MSRQIALTLTLGLTLFSLSAEAAVRKADRPSYDRAYAAAAFPITGPLVTDGGSMTLVWDLDAGDTADLIDSADAADINATAPPNFEFSMVTNINVTGSGAATVTCAPGVGTWTLDNGFTVQTFTPVSLGSSLFGDDVTIGMLMDGVPAGQEPTNVVITVTLTGSDMFATATYGDDTPGADTANGKCSNGSKNDNLLFY